MPPKYSYRVAWSDTDNAWIAISPEFGRTVSAFGDTPQEAMTELDIARGGVIEIYASESHPLPRRIDAEETAFYLVESWETN